MANHDKDTYLVATNIGDANFLVWLHQRLRQVHGESPEADYMLTLKKFVQFFDRKEYFNIPRPNEDMTDAEIERWIDVIGHGPAQKTLRHYLQLRRQTTPTPETVSPQSIEAQLLAKIRKVAFKESLTAAEKLHDIRSFLF